MLTIYLLWMCLLVSLCAAESDHMAVDDSGDYVDGQDQEYMENKKREKAFIEKLKSLKPRCNEPSCSFLRCEDAGPPPFCPLKVLICRTGCVNIQYCKDPEKANYFYQDKFCSTPHRFTPDVFSTKRVDYYYED